jgi:hypothetical protein
MSSRNRTWPQIWVKSEPLKTIHCFLSLNSKEIDRERKEGRRKGGWKDTRMQEEGRKGEKNIVQD